MVSGCVRLRPALPPARRTLRTHSPLPENPSESRQHTRACAYGPVSRPARFLAPPALRDLSWGHFFALDAARGSGRKAGEIRTAPAGLARFAPLILSANAPPVPVLWPPAGLPGPLGQAIAY